MVGRILLAVALVLAPATAAAQTGVLVVAHGADLGWNNRVRETVAQVQWNGPVAIAFLMGAEKDSVGWSSGVQALVAQGAKRIAVVPLMVSSHGSHYRQIRHYAGELAEMPAELSGHDHGMPEHPDVPMAVSPALDAAPEFAEALASRWRALDGKDRARPVLLVAHGPNAPDDAERWVADISAVSAELREATGGELHVGLLRDDAPAEVRAAAVAAMRDTVLAMAKRSGDSVLALPVMISAGSITRVKIPRDLDGLPISYHAEPLAPSPALARWIERMAGRTVGSRR